MKNIMGRAWEIARSAKAEFGGDLKSYFPEALAMAWEECRKQQAAPAVILTTFELPADTKKYRTWLAVIKGTHPVYKLDREFVRQDDTDQWGEKVFRLPNGYYESNNGKRRVFFRALDGLVIELDKQEVYDAMGVAG